MRATKPAPSAQVVGLAAAILLSSAAPVAASVDVRGSRPATVEDLVSPEAFGTVRLNREAAILTYFGEEHSLFSRTNLRDMHQRILARLDRNLCTTGREEALRPSAGPDLHD